MSGRIRSVKPEWLEDELLAAASDEARVLSVGLILAADDYGNGRATIATIAADVWRYQMGREDGAHAHEVVAKASRAFRELLAIRFVGEWTERGQRYYAIRNWKKHQKVDKPGKPIVPSPPPGLFDEKPAESEHSRDTRESVASQSREPRETLAPDLRPTTNDLEVDRSPPPIDPPEKLLRDTVCNRWHKTYQAHRNGDVPRRDIEAAREVVAWLVANAPNLGIVEVELLDEMLAAYWREPWPRDRANRASLVNLSRQLDRLRDERAKPTEAEPVSLEDHVARRKAEVAAKNARIYGGRS